MLKRSGPNKEPLCITYYVNLMKNSVICLGSLLLLLQRMNEIQKTFVKAVCITLCEKCPYSEISWFVISRIRAEYGETLRICSYSVWMRENADQNNFEYWHFLRRLAMNNSWSVQSRAFKRLVRRAPARPPPSTDHLHQLTTFINWPSPFSYYSDQTLLCIKTLTRSYSICHLNPFVNTYGIYFAKTPHRYIEVQTASS